MMAVSLYPGFSSHSLRARPNHAPCSPSLSTLRFIAVHSAQEADRPPGMITSAAPSLYEALGVTAGAKNSEIKAAYRRLARECHPDVLAAGREGASTDEFMRIHTAYKTLSDPVKRADYDKKQLRQPVAFSSFSPSRFSRRAWETDQCW